MNILHKLHQALINSGWIRGGGVREPKEPWAAKWEDDPFYRDTKALQLLDHRIENVREMMLKAQRQKKRWKHHEAKWKHLCWKRAELTGTK